MACANGLEIWTVPFLFLLCGRDEPPHVHVERDDNVAKFWVDPVRLAESGGFRRNELREIERIVSENETVILEAWHGFFGS